MTAHQKSIIMHVETLLEVAKRDCFNPSSAKTALHYINHYVKAIEEENRKHADNNHYCPSCHRSVP